MNQFNQRLQKIHERIRQTEQATGRRAGSAHLLAVSKTRPADDIRAVYACGQRDFGENYLQEALEKMPPLADLAICWHFIGPIQSNKTLAIASHFDWVHSVDRLKVARRLAEQRPPERGPLDICLQVNISGEASKAGSQPAEAVEIAQEISQLANLRLRGLMAIPAPAQDLSEQRRPFRQLRELLERINAQHGLQLDTLSMGMSGDMEAAIAEGATWVRIGTDLFGPRPPR
ncbi:MAG: YggS family pyridoxal phosphate-dependent enzyme [Gammaproteobacteria bacterium]